MPRSRPQSAEQDQARRTPANQHQPRNPVSLIPQASISTAIASRNVITGLRSTREAAHWKKSASRALGLFSDRPPTTESFAPAEAALAPPLVCFLHWFWCRPGAVGIRAGVNVGVGIGRRSFLVAWGRIGPSVMAIRNRNCSRIRKEPEADVVDGQLAAPLEIDPHIAGQWRQPVSAECRRPRADRQRRIGRRCDGQHLRRSWAGWRVIGHRMG